MGFKIVETEENCPTCGAKKQLAVEFKDGERCWVPEGKV